MKLRFKRRLTAPQLLLLFLSLVAGCLLIYKLGSLVPGLAASEQPLPGFHNNLHSLWRNPVDVPFKLSQLLVAALLPSGGYTASRLPAVIIGLVILGVLYWLLKQWYGQRLAIFGLALLMTAPWFLHISRLADSSIMYPLGMSVILALAAAWHKTKRRLRLLYISSLAVALILYIPGAIWLLLCLLAVEYKHMLTSIKAGRWHSVAASLLGLAALTPLIHSLLLEWRSYQLYLGWAGGWPQLIDYPRQFVTVWLNIFIHGYNDPVYNLGGLPVVSILMSLAFVVGVYLYSQHFKAARPRLLALLWIVGTGLISLPGKINLALILPILFVLATGGIGYLLHLWLRVFPRNPLARGFGIGLIGLVVLIGVGYNLRNYYVAWPHNSETRAAFSRRL